MADLFFVLKTLVLSILVVAGLQIKVGERRAEEIIYNYVKHTSAHKWLKQISYGAVDYTKSIFSKTETSVETNYPEGATDSDSALSLLDQ